MYGELRSFGGWILRRFIYLSSSKIPPLKEEARWKPDERCCVV
jgi:hypothetical protein